MKKVILLAPLPPPIGGIAGWTKRIIEAKLKNSWEVFVVDEKLIGDREVFGDKCKRNFFTELKRCCIIWHNLFKALSDEEAVVVHSCIPSALLSMIREYVCALITKVKRRKFIVHFRCTVPNITKGHFARFWLKRLCNISDAVIVLNSKSRDFLQSITNTSIVLIPNFVSGCEICDYRKVANEIKTAVYVGGVIREKGCIDIIEAAKKLNNINFRLIGSSDDEVRSLAKDVANVSLIGVLDRSSVMCEMKQADVFVFLTKYIGEGFSNALVEAMAAGLPCIVSDWAANRDMIEEKGGIVVNSSNVDEVVSAFREIEKKDIRQMQSDYNINKVRNEYSDKIVLDMYVDLYEELIGKKS